MHILLFEAANIHRKRHSRRVMSFFIPDNRMCTRRIGRWLPKQPRLGARICQSTFFICHSTTKGQLSFMVTVLFLCQKLYQTGNYGESFCFKVLRRLQPAPCRDFCTPRSLHRPVSPGRLSPRRLLRLRLHRSRAPAVGTKQCDGLAGDGAVNALHKRLELALFQNFCTHCGAAQCKCFFCG